MKIIGIVVLYNPSGNYLTNLEILSSQVDSLCVIDNSDETHEEELWKVKNLVYFPQFMNLGIAKAQNVGIKYAIDNRYDYILFSDPDSFIPQNSIAKLVSTFLNLCKRGCKVGAVGSTAINQMTGNPYGIRKWTYIGEFPDEKVTEVTHTMNSISLIPTQLFKEVGLMDESLFIDGVDYEWCWRAKDLVSARFFVSSDVWIEHNLGKETRHFLNRSVYIAAPKRLYYEYRNYIWLCRRSYVPLKWKKYNAWKYLLKIPYYSLFVSPRWKNFKFIVEGVLDGLNKNG